EDKEPIENAKMMLDPALFGHDGKEKPPTATVTLDSKELEEGIDYRVSYENNVDVGEAQIVIKGIIKYECTLEKTFLILDDISSISDLRTMFDQHVEAGDITNDEAIHAFKIHFQALAQFERSGNDEKVVKHLNGFKDLVKYHQAEEHVSDETYEALTDGADMLIDKLK